MMDDDMVVEPGWLHAEGDPPGTQRYWDGSEWRGDPVPVEPQPSAPPPVAGPSAAPPAGPMSGIPAPPSAVGSYHGRPLASIGNRFLARLLDGLLIVVLVYIPIAVVVGIGFAIHEVLGALLAVVGVLAALAAIVYGWMWALGETGQSPGRRMMGTELIKKDTGAHIGGGMGILRFFTDYLNSLACYLGWLWPFWDKDRQTFSDKILGTVTVETEKKGLFPLFPNGKPF